MRATKHNPKLKGEKKSYVCVLMSYLPRYKKPLFYFFLFFFPSETFKTGFLKFEERINIRFLLLFSAAFFIIYSG